MLNTESTKLFKVLNPGHWENKGETVFYNKQQAVQACLSFPIELNLFLESFKLEFQENELIPDSEPYIERTTYNFTSRLVELKNYQEKEITPYRNELDIITIQSSSEIVNHFEQLGKINFSMLALLLEYQIKTCTDALHFINKSNNITSTIPKIESNYPVPFIINETKKVVSNFIPIPNSSNLHKATFKGNKIDLIVFYYFLHHSGIVTFTERKYLQSFLENNFIYKYAGNDKNVTDVLNEISEIIKCVKNPEQVDEIGVMKWRKKKNNTINKMVSSLQTIITELENNKESTNIPPRNNTDGWA